MTDYSEFTVALEALVKRLQQAMREKRYGEADHCAAEAMKNLARLHAVIARLQQ